MIPTVDDDDSPHRSLYIRCYSIFTVMISPPPCINLLRHVSFVGSSRQSHVHKEKKPGLTNACQRQVNNILPVSMVKALMFDCDNGMKVTANPTL